MKASTFKKISCQLIALTLTAAALSAESTARIVTVGGAATEIVFALNRGDDVVGVDLSSTYPQAATKLPQVGYVRSISAEGVLALEPTHIVGTSDIGPANALNQIKASGVPTSVIPSPGSPEDLYQAIQVLGEELEQTEAATQLKSKIESQLASIQKLETKPKVVFFMSSPGLGHLNAAGRGTKATAMIELAGGENVIRSHPGYKSISHEALVALQPDIILIGLAEGMPHNETRILDGVLHNAAWQNVPAVREKQVHTVPLGRTLSFGVRVGEAALELNQLFAETVSN
ncbi:ABC transporter substrate-binding protein [Coraliomargarita sp. SDUM461003]|uniref:ABC transporter substrate-binding protein n=1 Tax=Thalassobacterium maritimum TaxID=3041265 RepID=A0ABU1ASP0_9BACT|nr:ABC transporter substrate-binding protein [Coraliomargarita sp. SDUM461003]MDQ8206259.1 ABC transporter substrate-binding protein [Coraliomargarita sp. SDUM461003]